MKKINWNNWNWNRQPVNILLKGLLSTLYSFAVKNKNGQKIRKATLYYLQNPDLSSLFVAILLSLRTKVFQKPNVPMLSSVLVKLACGVEEGINGVEKVINTIVSHRL